MFLAKYIYFKFFLIQTTRRYKKSREGSIEILSIQGFMTKKFVTFSRPLP